MRRWWNRHSAARFSVRVGPGCGRPSASASWSYSVDVVDVAAPGRAGAPREHAGAIAEDHLLADPVGDLVRRCGEVGVEVDDRLDGDLGAGVAAPVLDLVEEDEALALLHPPGRAEHGGQPVEGRRRSGRGARPRGRRADRRRPVRSAGALGVEVERGLGARQVAEGSGAAGAERRVGPEGLQAGGAVGERAVEVEGVGDVELGLDAHRAGVVHVVVVDRGVARVDVEVAVLRIRGRVESRRGRNRLIVSATSRSSCAAPTRPATAATWASTNPAASTVSAGVEWMVASATARARHAGTRPAWTCAHSRGRRWRSSRAWPTSFFAAVVETPRTVPSSARQNSATSGAPSPAMGSSCSQPGHGERRRRRGSTPAGAGRPTGQRATSRSAAARSSARLPDRGRARAGRRR